MSVAVSNEVELHGGRARATAGSNHIDDSQMKNRSFMFMVSLWLHEMCTRYVPSLQWLQSYTREELISDLLAGLTVGFFIVPQVGVFVSVRYAIAQFEMAQSASRVCLAGPIVFLPYPRPLLLRTQRCSSSSSPSYSSRSHFPPSRLSFPHDSFVFFSSSRVLHTPFWQECPLTMAFIQLFFLRSSMLYSRHRSISRSVQTLSQHSY